MPQIVTDIRKPSAAIKQEPVFREIQEEKKEEVKKEFGPQIPKKEEKIRKPKSSSRNFFIPIILVVFFIFGLGIYSYFFSAGATVTVWPKQEKLEQDIKLIVDQKANDISVLSKTIPGTLFQQEQTISQDFQATGKSAQGSKAQGVIRVYNNYSTASQTLVATTRFISSSGKLFRSTARVVIPGQTSANGKLQPGFIDINVIADQVGEDYNIGPSDFSIPGFAGTPKYTGFYGKSSEAMKGGYKGSVMQVTQKDIDDAKVVATQKISSETEKGLKEKIPSDYIFVDNSIKDDVLDVKAPKVGETGESFSIQIKGVSSVLAFRKIDFDNFVSQSIILQKPPEKTMYKESLKTDYNLDSSQMDSGKIILNLKISAQLYSAINEDAIKQNILGVAPAQIKEIMSTDPKIDRIEIKLLPPWTKAVPNDKNKINLKISLTQ